MRSRILAFLTEIDKTLAEIATNGETLDVYHIGRSSLLVEFEYGVTTTDVDILGTPQDSDLMRTALELFGKRTANADRLGLYLDRVDIAYPPTPTGYRDRAHRVPGDWQVVRLFHLDPHDLVATKLRRFAPKDRADIRYLADEGLLDADTLEARLQSAFQWNLEKDGDDYRDVAFRNLATVRRYLNGETWEF